MFVAAIGRANFVKSSMVKEGAVIIDVGINRLDTGKLAGDVDFQNVISKCSMITPVPGGVGPKDNNHAVMEYIASHLKNQLVDCLTI